EGGDRKAPYFWLCTKSKTKPAASKTAGFLSIHSWSTGKRRQQQTINRAARRKMSRIAAGAFDAGRRFTKGQKDEGPGKHFCLTET
ncbi:hypothetical protein DPP89_23885, partial [Salmonella enterica subsp. enterica]|nr:hypothetical protein [Salmonella enterica subsp. enterica serovar Thompson]